MIRKILASTVCAAALSAGAAHAQTTLNYGGSSLAAPTYIAEFQKYTGANPNNLFSFEAVGSGGGQKAFLNNDITQFENLAPGILSYGTIVGTTVHSGESDAALTASQLTSSTTGAYGLSNVDGPLIEWPTFGTPITFPYVNAGLKVTQKLTDDQICGILSGKITNWSSISTTSGTIQVVYRSDSSGTTFLLTQHLNAVCTSANSSFPVLPVAITKTFSSLFTGGVPPANFTGESGSQNVAQQMSTTPLSFGYLSPDYTTIAPKSANNIYKLKVASVLNSINNTYYTPSVANTEAALQNPGAGSQFNTIPSTLAQAQYPLNWVPLIPVANKGYPVVGYTTALISQCYAVPAVSSQTIAFWKLHFANSAYITIIENNGFAPLSTTGKSGEVTAIQNDFLSNKSGYNLDIGDKKVCGVNGVTGR